MVVRGWSWDDFWEIKKHLVAARVFCFLHYSLAISRMYVITTSSRKRLFGVPLAQA